MFRTKWARFFRKTQSEPQPEPQSDTVLQAIQNGLEHHQAGRLQEAERCYTEVLQVAPGNADALHLLGVIASQVGKHEIAVELIDKALASKPDFAEALCNRGNALQELKRYEEALASYERALSIKPDIAETLSNRGNVLKALKRYEEALASFDAALSVKPDYAEALYNRGATLQELKRLDEAVASYDRAIAIKPDQAEAHYNRGTALQELLQLEAAVASYDRAIAIKPDYAKAYSNRGTVLMELMRLDEAVASYDRAIAIELDYADFYWNKSMVLLLLGDFKNGWPLYEWRWKRKEENKSRRDLRKPLWQGKDSISGKTVLLHSEQGFGDTIQFCRYARLVAGLGARVIMELPEPLMHLLEDLEGVSEFVVKGSALPVYDYHCPLLTLPLAFNTDLGSIPSFERYLSAGSERLASWRARLGEKTKPRIGLVWSGSTEHKYDHNRSLSLGELLRHLPPQYQYVSLQREVRGADRPVLDARPDILHFGDELQDFADTAALCEHMDRVISVDTSVAHLAGALGRPVWILLPFRPDWRWLLDRTDSPWYPSARLFRQANAGGWGAVLETLRTELVRLA